MLQVQPFDSAHFNESQLYEDLSQIIKSFKKILTLLDNIAINLLKFESTSHLFQQLKQTLDNLQSFSKIYFYIIHQDSPQKNTFHRFVCRLIESISAYKVKLQNLPYFSTLSNEVKEIEFAIMSYQQDKNVGMVIKKIQNIVNRFCSKTIKSLQINCNSSQKNQRTLHSDENSEFTPLTHKYSNPDDQNGKFIFTINEIKPKKVVQSKSQNSLNKVMNLLNRKYRTFACLDVDYNEFKQIFFRSRDSRNELYDDCFERNSFIYKEIIRYSKQFSEYLEKRNQKIIRKNKFVESLAQNNIKVKNKLGSGKNQDSPQINFNFTKKKILNNDSRKMTENLIQNQSQIKNESGTTDLLSKSQLVDERFFNVVSIENPQSGHFTPQLLEQKKKPNIFPLMINGNQFLQERERLQDITTQNFLQLSKRKKNLQLKKIDISLTSIAKGANDIQNSKIKNTIMNGEAFKKVSINNPKQTEDKINGSIRKNYLQKKYEKAMKKNINPSVLQFDEELPVLQLPLPSKNSSTKFLQFQQQSPVNNRGSQHRKYLIKTSNKRQINSGTQYKSLNPNQQRREISTIKNFRTLKMDQTQKIEKLERMKESHMQFLGGGKGIRPAYYYRQRQHTASMQTQEGQNDFSDMKMGSYKELEEQNRQF